MGRRAEEPTGTRLQWRVPPRESLGICSLPCRTWEPHRRRTTDAAGCVVLVARSASAVWNRPGRHDFIFSLRAVRCRSPSPHSRRSFSIVGLALYGLPFFYDFMVRDFGWTRTQVTSGNAYSKLIVGPLFGFMAGWLVDRFGPRRLMLVGIAMAGVALIGLGFISSLAGFYFFYLFNALGYVCGGPLPNQVLLSRWFDRSRGKAMGLAYLGIGIGGAVVPLVAVVLVRNLGWQPALQVLGVLIIAIAMPLAWFVKDAPVPAASDGSNPLGARAGRSGTRAGYPPLGSSRSSEEDRSTCFSSRACAR